MNTKIAKQKVTLMLDRQVYLGLLSKFGARGMGTYLSSLARPFVVESDLGAGYKAMAADQEHEEEALEWIEGTRVSIQDENNWNFKN
jgi:hypothetical protein